jgi:protein-S-isoprenylcysteine O-methyltransferase Ste14
MRVTLRVIDSKAANFLMSGCMALLCTLFAYRHILAFARTNDWTYLLICVSETLIAIFFTFRRTPVSMSTNVSEWAIAIVGTFAPLFLTPAPWGVFSGAKHAIPVAVILQILGVISLNRSFALVAAKREIKTCGMYRFVRHPLYLSYLVMFSAYVLANTTPPNLLIYILTMSCLLVRILHEEKHLAIDPLYQSYMKRVRYRVVPLMF